MSGQEAKAPPLRFRMSHAESAERAEGELSHAKSAKSAKCARIIDTPWQRKRLSELVFFSKGKGYSKSDIMDSGSPLFLYGRLYTDYKTEVADVDTFAEMQKGSVLSNGDEIVVPGSGETPEDIARASAIVAKGIILGGDLNILKPKDSNEIYTPFLAMALSNGKASCQIAERAQGKTVVHIHNSDLEDLVVAYPMSDTEQRHIGSFFRSLDALIAGREKALEKLETLKKSMLLKMFPQGDATVPEVRFKGFAGDWEKKAFGEIATRKSIMGNAVSLPRVEYEDVIPFSGFFNKDIFAKPSDKVGIQFSKGDVLFGKLRPYLGNWIFAEFNGLAVGDWWVLKPAGIDPEFLYTLIQSPLFQDVANQSSGSKMPRADWNLVSNTFFACPNSHSEQCQIGAYFRSLDVLIAARREEIGKLKQMKKALLERMFV